MNDAMRLCSAYIPNETQISACMEAKRTELTPGCRAFFTNASTETDDVKPAKLTKVKDRGPHPVSVR